MPHSDDEEPEPQDDRTGAERESQAQRLKFDERLTDAFAAADVVYQNHYQEDAANLDQIEASCKGPALHK